MGNKPSGRGGWWLKGWVIAVAVGGFCVGVLAVLLWCTPGGIFVESARNVLLVAGGLVAVVGVGLSLSRHREELDSADRDQEKEARRTGEAESQRKADAERDMRARYVTAVELLSDPEKPMKRAAGLRALGALADDWDAHGNSDEVQVCIDTICDYLRRVPEFPPGEPTAPGSTDDDRPAILRAFPRTPQDEIPVRLIGYRILRDHLSGEADHKWGGLRVDLSNMQLDFDVDLSGIEIRGGVLDLSRSTVHSESVLLLDDAVLYEGGCIDLTQASIVGFGEDTDIVAVISMCGLRALDTSGITFHRSRVISGGELRIHASHFGGASHLEVSGLLVDRARASLIDLTFADDAGAFLSLRVQEGGSVPLFGLDARRSGAVGLYSEPDTGGEIRLDGARLTEGGWSLNGAEFTDDGPIELEGGRRLTPAVSRPPSGESPEG